jgi:hypothetical protein
MRVIGFSTIGVAVAMLFFRACARATARLFTGDE